MSVETAAAPTETAQLRRGKPKAHANLRIVKQVDAGTRAKTSVNELLRA
jgi:tetrahydrodipicolinate N-succinyltransferase